MQNYYLHHEVSARQAAGNLRAFRIESGEGAIASRGCHLQLYRLLDDDLTLLHRYSFQATIDAFQVLPSRVHKHDYAWVLDKKGRFCMWHPFSIDLVHNCVLWESQDELEGRFSGASWQFEGNNTVGTIFFTGRNTLVLLHFRISERGAHIDQSNIIQYPLLTNNLRFAGFIAHSQSLFLLGLIEQEQGKSCLCVYDLEKGLGVCAQSMEWRFEKVNMLHFCSAVSGEVLIVTYNEVSLHTYKSSSSLRTYRTRGNYGHGFYLGNGFYGHIGEELIAFSRDKLRTYGQVRTTNEVSTSFSKLCLTHCSVLGQLQHEGSILAVQTYDGNTYLLRLFKKSFTMSRLFDNLGTFLELCCLQEDKLFAVVSQQNQCFRVSLLEKQQHIQTKIELKLPTDQIQKIFPVSGGIFMIFCNHNSNKVFRLGRSNQYQSYFPLPEGHILSAQDSFIVYDSAIYQVDYQCLTLSYIVESNLLLAEITKEVIYYLEEGGNLRMFDKESDQNTVLLKGRQHDYCWGIFSKLSILVTANLMEPREVRLLSPYEQKTISIKGHTLVTSICCIAQKRITKTSDLKVLVGYADGQIHMHSTQNEFLHSTYMFDFYGSAPVSLLSCGEDTVLANYINKQYTITASKDDFTFTNVLLTNTSAFLHLMAYIQKTGELLLGIRAAEGSKLRRLAIKPNKDVKLYQWRAMELGEWNTSVPLLMSLDDGLLVVGCGNAELIRLQSQKVAKKCNHGLKEVVGVQQIKLGILICGVDFQGGEYLIVLNEELEIVCRFHLQTKPPVRCLRTLQENTNQFLLAHDDSLTLYTISSSMHLHSVLGRKLETNGYQIDAYEGNLLLNDPWRSLSLLQMRESIITLGSYLPPHRLTHTLFLQEDIFCADQSGRITLLSARTEQILESFIKFIRVFSFSADSQISAVHRIGTIIYYATTDGGISAVRVITRDHFDDLKKVESEALLQMDTRPAFNYWQWKDRLPAHQRIIDAQIFPNHCYL